MVHATRLPPVFKRHLEIKPWKRMQRGAEASRAENILKFVWISFQNDLEETHIIKRKMQNFFLSKLLNEQTLQSLSVHDMFFCE